MRKRVFFLIFWQFLYFCALFAQPEANAVLPKNRIETGDTFQVRIIVKGTGVKPEKTDISAWKSLLPPENMLHQTDWALQEKNWVQEQTWISFDSATLNLPPLPVLLHLGTVVKTNALELTVYPTRASDELADMEPIRDIYHEPTLWWDYWPWLLGVVVLSFLLFRLLNKKPKKAPIVAAPVPVAERPLQEVFIKKLEDLQHKDLWKKGQIKPYCAELSLLLREYLEKKYKFPAMESTTREIMQRLGNTDMPLKYRNAISEILEQTDMAKYAKSQPDLSFYEKSLQYARLVFES